METELSQEQESAEQKENRKPWLFKKGQSGNPSGRPKGSISLKTYAKEMLEKMTEEERQDFLHGLPKDVIWEMAEGKPQTNTDITSGGKPIPILNVLSNNSNPKDTEPKETN